MFVVVLLLGVVVFGGLMLLVRGGDLWAEKEFAAQDAAIKQEMENYAQPSPPPGYVGNYQPVVVSRSPAREDSSPKSTVLRISRIITDDQGRTLDVIITGRTLTQIHFLTKDRSWVWPIEKLSSEDQIFARTLPIDTQ